MSTADADTEDVDWDTIGYVTASRYRRLTLARLGESPATPSTIAADQGVACTHTSRALRGLRDRGLVELLVPEDRRKGRVYGATDEGSAALNGMRKIGEVGP